VNLAALDEVTAAEERQGYLDAQNDDLVQAITTLEDAIRRIDRETREQLRQTYDTVNRQFGELFPQLFGGGRAELVMTGEEILDAGIQIVAQPPGKKNSSIHLLSGGEKALTAIALVFSMFQLNPAPFCMLDEVDAPLDDANTERYCNLVRRMSSQTQFVFISHSKITMEIAEQLVGVTMQEQGVSRVVEVDMEAALRLAEPAEAVCSASPPSCTTAARPGAATDRNNDGQRTSDWSDRTRHRRGGRHPCLQQVAGAQAPQARGIHLPFRPSRRAARRAAAPAHRAESGRRGAGRAGPRAGRRRRPALRTSRAATNPARARPTRRLHHLHRGHRG